MKLFFLLSLLSFAGSLWAQSSSSAAVRVQIHIHSLMSVDDLVSECVQSGKNAKVTFTFETVSNDFLDVYLSVPERIHKEEYFVEEVRVTPEYPHRLFSLNRGIFKKSATVDVLNADFDFCENPDQMLITVLPR